MSEPGALAAGRRRAHESSQPTAGADAASRPARAGSRRADVAISASWALWPGTVYLLPGVSTAAPGQFLAAFGPGRSKVFGNSADDDLKVHAEGSTWADVTEGSGGVWERLHYDWSNPNRIVMATTDSNVWGGGSGHTYTLSSRPDGTTTVDAVVVREGKNLKGRMLGFLLGTDGKRVLAKQLAKTIKAIEARNNVPQTA